MPATTSRRRIISQAGVPGAITIATDMAGRGTDIQLGGNADMRIKQELKEVGNATGEHDPRAAEIRAQVARLKEKALAAGGLFVLGTERHESRRIDNQLRGRSGRQGDPGHSKFFLSLEDDLMRIFGSDKLDSMLQRLGLKENEAIVHSWINKALEKAQQKVEARNFDIRKNLLKFDNVMNDQRKVIFEQRIEWMRDEAVNEIVADMRHAAIEELVARHLPHNACRSNGTSQVSTARCATSSRWRSRSRHGQRRRHYRRRDVSRDRHAAADRWMAAQGRRNSAPPRIRHMQRLILLHALDNLWREHLVTLDALRRAIGWRSYGRRQPLTEYKTEALHLFETMLRHLDAVVTALAMRVGIVGP